jgi:hypothetical protein
LGLEGGKGEFVFCWEVGGGFDGGVFWGGGGGGLGGGGVVVIVVVIVVGVFGGGGGGWRGLDVWWRVAEKQVQFVVERPWMAVEYAGVWMGLLFVCLVFCFAWVARGVTGM